MPPPPPPYGGGTGFGGQALRLWPLVLTKGARTMTIVFIVVGALSYVGYFVAIPTILGVTHVQSALATAEVESAYSSLTAATETFRASTQTCTSASTPSSAQLSCLEQADKTWSSALQSYGSSISEVSYPSASTQAAAAAATSSVASAVTVLDSLAASPTVQAYSAAASSPALQTALNNVDQTYDQLIQALSNS
jgi:hypothetical protein